MTTKIETIIEGYAEGKTEIKEALDQMRQLEEKPVEATDSPYSNEYEDYEGSWVELYSMCVAYDLPYSDLDLFGKALRGVPVYAGRLETKPEPEAKFDETTVPSLIEMLGGEDDDLVVAPMMKDPADGDKEPVEEPEPVDEAPEAPEPLIEEPVADDDDDR